jgi:hypothetical protein
MVDKLLKLGRWLKCPYCHDKYLVDTDGDICLYKALQDLKALRKENAILRKSVRRVVGSDPRK